MQITEIYKSLAGRVDPRGPAVCVCAADGLQSALLVVRQRIHISGRPQNGARRGTERSSRLSPGGGLVEITGGEPMLQEREVVPLMQRLLDANYTVLLETSGERPLERVPAGVIKIVDVKCPDSGEGDTFLHGESGDADSPQTKSSLCSAAAPTTNFAREFTQRHNLARTGERGTVFARVPQGRNRRPRQFALPARSAGTGGVDDCRQRSRPAGTAVAQVHLGSGGEGSLGKLLIFDCRL